LSGPWQSPDAAIVLDPYHANQYTIDDLRLDPRIAGIVHKASEGATGRHGFVVDGAYASRRRAALAAGYLWGSYHLGRPGNPEDQADRYYALVRPATNEVLALDLEQDGGAMSMAEAARFIRRLHTLTGRYPLIYGGRATVSRPVDPGDLDTFRHCPLWIVDTRNTPRGWPTSIWPQYTLWQFSSELRYRYPFHSADAHHPVSWDTDVDFFAGSRDELRRRWPFS
jgi:lysozyme